MGGKGWVLCIEVREGRGAGSIDLVMRWGGKVRHNLSNLLGMLSWLLLHLVLATASSCPGYCLILSLSWLLPHLVLATASSCHGYCLVLVFPHLPLALRLRLCSR